MNDPAERLEKMVARLKERECRLTPQRMAVLRVLASSEGHPSVEQIYERIKPEFPTTSVATVYKTIHLLKEMGEVLELGFSDASNRYDGNNPNPHPHLICVGCGRVLDPEVEGVEDLRKKLAETTGFRMVNYRMDFYGICPKCQKKK